MKIMVGVSNRHIHLKQEDYNVLFGNKKMELLRAVNQPGEYASNLVVTLKTDKNEIKNVRVMGPIRSYSQAEVSKTDSFTLGINPLIRKSGNTTGTCMIEVVGPNGSVEIPVIMAERHIHISKVMLEKYGWDEHKEKMVLVNTTKGGIIANVKLKVTDDSFFEIHLDTDDANAFLLKSGDIVDIIEN